MSYPDTKLHLPLMRPRWPTFESGLFAIATFWGAALIWLAPRPPLVDLPQHAAQVALLHDLSTGNSPWESLLFVNFFTPYLLGYSLALVLSFFMPIATAFKVLLSLSYLGFVMGCVAVSRRLGADRRLDWLFIPGYFSFAYHWGFVTFLISAPLGLSFILQAGAFAKTPRLRAGAYLTIISLLLFFCHGLIFLFANAIGFLTTVFTNCRRKVFVLSLIPYFCGLLLCIIFILVRWGFEVNYTANIEPITLAWGDWVNRLSFPIKGWNYPKYGVALSVIGFLLLISPFLIKSEINRKNVFCMIPFGALVLIWALVPSTAMKTAYLFERFSLFFLPFWAFIFVQPKYNTADGAHTRSMAAIWRLIMPVLSIFALAIHAYCHFEFKKESANFEEILAAMEAKQRGLMLIYDKSSDVYPGINSYLHYPAWYQAEKQGLVDFNFAVFFSQIIRFKYSHIPTSILRYGYSPELFDWDKNQGWQYRYFIVRSDKQAIDNIIKKPNCLPTLTKLSGQWALYENDKCYEPARF